MSSKRESRLPSSWELVEVSDAIEKPSLVNKKLPQKNYELSGKLPVVDQGQDLIGGYTDKENLKLDCELPVIVFGDHTRAIKYVDFDFVTGADGVKVLKPLGMFYPKLFYYFLRAVHIPNRGYSRHFQFLEKSYLPLPPLNEQRRIVAEIEKQFARLNEAVAALTRVADDLKKYRASVLKAACEGRLVETEAELAREEGRDYEAASELLQRILIERRARWEANYLARMKAQGKEPTDDKWKSKYVEPQEPQTGNLPELPEGWSYTHLKPLLSTMRAGMKTGPFGSLLKKHEHRKEGVPVLGIENIASMKFIKGSNIYISPNKADELSSYDACPGDILISRSGTVGEVCVVPDDLGEARISTNIMRVSLSSNGLLPMFFCILFNGSPLVLSQVRDLCKGSTRNFLNQEILSSIVFPVPPLAEQKRIVEEVEKCLSVADELQEIVAASIERAEDLRRAILKRAFEGRLVPQDPNDEPASVLLERISAERACLEAESKAKKKGGKANARCFAQPALI